MADSDPIHLPEGVPEEAVDALYGLPLDEFTARRDDLAKELRSAGRRDGAAWVKALRKPSAAAWLVNQLARTQKKDARRVLDSGEALRSAQDRALAGEGSREELARAAEEHADAMRALAAKAPGLLDRRGGSPSEATLERAAETLRAIALDDEARASFASGRLTRERRAAGLGFVPSAEGAPAEAQPKQRDGARGKQKEGEATAEQKARARAAVNEAKTRHRDQGKQVAELERELRRAEREAQSAQRRVEKAASALGRAREKQAETQARVEEAEAAAKRL